MIPYKRNKISYQPDIEDGLQIWNDRWLDWEYEWYDEHEHYLNQESERIGYTISHEFKKEFYQKNARNHPSFVRKKEINYGVVDMESFYDKQTLRDKKIDILLGDVKDLSNTIENILKEKNANQKEI